MKMINILAIVIITTIAKMSVFKEVMESGYTMDQCRFFFRYDFNDNWFEMVKTGQESFKIGSPYWIEIPPMYFGMIQDANLECSNIVIQYPDKEVLTNNIQIPESLNLDHLTSYLWYIKRFYTKEEANQMAWFLKNISIQNTCLLHGVSDVSWVDNAIKSIESFIREKNGQSNQYIKYLVETDQSADGLLSTFLKERSGIDSLEDLLVSLRKLSSQFNETLAKLKNVHSIFQTILGHTNEPVNKIDLAEYQKIVERTYPFSENRPRQRNITDLQVAQLKYHFKTDINKMSILNKYPHFIVPFDLLPEEDILKVVEESKIFVPDEELPPLPTIEKKIPPKNKPLQELIADREVPYATRKQVLQIILSERSYMLQDCNIEYGSQPYQLDFFNAIKTINKYKKYVEETIEWIQAEELWTDEMEAWYSK